MFKKFKNYLAAIIVSGAVVFGLGFASAQTSNLNSLLRLKTGAAALDASQPLQPPTASGGESFWQLITGTPDIVNTNDFGNVQIQSVDRDAKLVLRNTDPADKWNYINWVDGANRLFWSGVGADGSYFAISPNTGTGLTVAAQGGRVGVGTAPDAAARLAVAGQVKITGGQPDAGKVLVSDAAGLASWVSPVCNLGSGTTLPTCDESRRGMLWFVNNGANRDELRLCAYNGSTLSWRPIY